MKSSTHFTKILFLFIVLAARMVPAQDVQVYEVWRDEYFTQATTNRASTTLALSHFLGAGIYANYSGALLSASLKIPGSNSVALKPSGDNFILANGSGGSVRLSAPAPAGSYQFHVQGASQGSLAYSLALRIANYPQAQAVAADQDFVLQWDKTANTGAHDYLRVFIVDSENNLVFSQSQLPLSTTNLVIPAGTLQDASRYWAYLAVLHVFTRNGTGKLPYWETFERRITRFPLQTLNPAGVLSFSASIVSVSETEGKAYVTVRRTGGSSGTVTVDYFTDDATAKSNVNYTATAGTLTFPPGITSQTFAIPLLNDGVATAPLTAQITLTNATGGASLPVRPHSCLTIRDADNSAPGGASSAVVARVEFYAQTGTNSPTQSNLSVACRFYAELRHRYPGSISYGFCQLPNGKAGALARSETLLHGYYESSQDFPSAPALNAVFPPGKYSFIFADSSGVAQVASLNFGAESAFAAPYVTNWTAAQSIDPASNFTLNWTPLAGATANDFVRVIVKAPTGEYLIFTPDELEAGALPGSTHQYTIPANTLSYGTTYTVDVIFARLASAGPQATKDFPNAVATVHTTVLDIQTIDIAPLVIKAKYQ